MNHSNYNQACMKKNFSLHLAKSKQTLGQKYLPVLLDAASNPRYPYGNLL